MFKVNCSLLKHVPLTSLCVGDVLADFLRHLKISGEIHLNIYITYNSVGQEYLSTQLIIYDYLSVRLCSYSRNICRPCDSQVVNKIHLKHLCLVEFHVMVCAA